MSIVMRKGLALFSALTLVICAVFLLCSTVRGEEAAYTAFTKPSNEVDYELLYKDSLVLDDFSGVRAWEHSDSVKSITTSTYSGGTSCLLASADGDRRRSMTVSRELSDDDYAEGTVRLDAYRELSFSFLALGSTNLSYELRVTLFSESAEAVYTASLIPNDWQDVFLDLAMLDGETLRAISVTVSGTSAEAYVTSAALSMLALGDVSHSELSRRYSALYVYGAEIKEDAIRVPAKTQDAVVRAEALIPGYSAASSSTVMISLTLRGVGYAKLSILTSDEGAWREEEFREMTSFTVSSATDTYVCCFTQKGRLSSWALSFSALSVDKDDCFYIEKVSISVGEESGDYQSLANEALGRVTKCAYSGTDSIQITGTLSHSAAVEYIDAELELYMIPGWQSTAGALDGEPVLTSDVSTEFSFKLPLESFPTAPGCFFAVVLTRDNEKAVIADRIRVAVPSAFVQSQLPKLIVSSDHDDDIFSYGAQALVIDVNLSKLLRPANDSGTRLVIWGDSFFYFSQSALSAITAKSEFYTACGMQYYFRLICSTDKYATASGIAAASYAIDVSDRLNYDMTAALVSFLSDRYSPVGYILGDRLNVAEKNASLRFSDMFSLMKQSADAARLIYSIASQKNPRTVVILPFEAVSDLPAAQNTRSTPFVHSAVSCVELADLYISAQGDVPVKWAALVHTDEQSASDVPSQSAFHTSGYLGSAVAPRDGEAATYAELSRAFSHALFYYLPLGENVAETLETQALVPEVRRMPQNSDAFAGSLYLWDFRRSFSTEKWVCSGSSKLTTGISTPLTEVARLLSYRALRIDLHSENSHEDASVIASAALANGLDLSECQYVEFRLAAFAPSGEAAFEIHLGDASGRWYYPVRVPDSGACSVLCRLPDNVSPTYFALSAKASDGVTVELGEVLAHSDSLSGEELARRALQSEVDQDTQDAESDDRLFQIAVSVIASLSIVIFAVLNHIQRQKKA